jgi:hypothetical protein
MIFLWEIRLSVNVIYDYTPPSGTPATYIRITPANPKKILAIPLIFLYPI